MDIPLPGEAIMPANIELPPVPKTGRVFEDIPLPPPGVPASPTTPNGTPSTTQLRTPISDASSSPSDVSPSPTLPTSAPPLPTTTPTSSRNTPPLPPLPNTTPPPLPGSIIYSPSRMDDDLLPPLPDTPPPKSSSMKTTVLGKMQAKKRLMAFSMTKQAGGSGLSFGFAKTSLKMNKASAQAFGEEDEDKKDGKRKKKKDEKGFLAIEEIKREEERMKEALLSRPPRYRERSDRRKRSRDRDREPPKAVPEAETEVKTQAEPAENTEEVIPTVSEPPKEEEGKVKAEAKAAEPTSPVAKTEDVVTPRKDHHPPPPPRDGRGRRRSRERTSGRHHSGEKGSSSRDKSSSGRHHSGEKSSPVKRDPSANRSDKEKGFVDKDKTSTSGSASATSPTVRRPQEMPDCWLKYKTDNCQPEDIRRLRRSQVAAAAAAASAAEGPTPRTKSNTDHRKRKSRSRSRERKRGGSSHRKRSSSSSRPHNTPHSPHSSSPPVEDKDLKLHYPFVAKGAKQGEREYPSHMLKYTKARPNLSYCENPITTPGYYKNREEVFKLETNQEIVEIMKELMNGVFSAGGTEEIGSSGLVALQVSYEGSEDMSEDEAPKKQPERSWLQKDDQVSTLASLDLLEEVTLLEKETSEPQKRSDKGDKTERVRSKWDSDYDSEHSQGKHAKNAEEKTVPMDIVQEETSLSAGKPPKEEKLVSEYEEFMKEVAVDIDEEVASEEMLMERVVENETDVEKSSPDKKSKKRTMDNEEDDVTKKIQKETKKEKKHHEMSGEPPAKRSRREKKKRKKSKKNATEEETASKRHKKKRKSRHRKKSSSSDDETGKNKHRSKKHAKPEEELKKSKKKKKEGNSESSEEEEEGGDVVSETVIVPPSATLPIDLPAEAVPAGDSSSSSSSPLLSPDKKKRRKKRKKRKKKRSHSVSVSGSSSSSAPSSPEHLSSSSVPVLSSLPSNVPPDNKDTKPTIASFFLQGGGGNNETVEEEKKIEPQKQPSPQKIFQKFAEEVSPSIPLPPSPPSKTASLTMETTSMCCVSQIPTPSDAYVNPVARYSPSQLSDDSLPPPSENHFPASAHAEKNSLEDDWDSSMSLQSLPDTKMLSSPGPTSYQNMFPFYAAAPAPVPPPSQINFLNMFPSKDKSTDKDVPTKIEFKPMSVKLKMKQKVAIHPEFIDDTSENKANKPAFLMKAVEEVNKSETSSILSPCEVKNETVNFIPLPNENSSASLSKTEFDLPSKFDTSLKHDLSSSKFDVSPKFAISSNFNLSANQKCDLKDVKEEDTIQSLNMDLPPSTPPHPSPAKSLDLSEEGEIRSPSVKLSLFTTEPTSRMRVNKANTASSRWGPPVMDTTSSSNDVPTVDKNLDQAVESSPDKNLSPCAPSFSSISRESHSPDRLRYVSPQMIASFPSPDNIPTPVSPERKSSRFLSPSRKSSRFLSPELKSSRFISPEPKSSRFISPETKSNRFSNPESLPENRFMCHEPNASRYSNPERKSRSPRRYRSPERRPKSPMRRPFSPDNRNLRSPIRKPRSPPMPRSPDDFRLDSPDRRFSRSPRRFRNSRSPRRISMERRPRSPPGFRSPEIFNMRSPDRMIHPGEGMLWNLDKRPKSPPSPRHESWTPERLRPRSPDRLPPQSPRERSWTPERLRPRSPDHPPMLSPRQKSWSPERPRPRSPRPMMRSPDKQLWSPERVCSKSPGDHSKMRSPCKSRSPEHRRMFNRSPPPPKGARWFTKNLKPPSPCRRPPPHSRSPRRNSPSPRRSHRPRDEPPRKRRPSRGEESRKRKPRSPSPHPPRRRRRHSGSYSPPPDYRRHSTSRPLEDIPLPKDHSSRWDKNLPGPSGEADMDLSSPCSSPLVGLKRSVADSTISDSELPSKQDEQEYGKNYAEKLRDYYNETGSYQNYQPFEEEEHKSPKRLSLDDRIELELGVKKDPPNMAPQAIPVFQHTSFSQYPSQYFPYFQQDAPQDRFDPSYTYDKSGKAAVAERGQNFPFEKPNSATSGSVLRDVSAAAPTNWDNPEAFIGQQNKASSSRVVQVGNVLQVVPSEEISIPICKPKTPPPLPATLVVSPSTASQVVQVGNILQVVPTPPGSKEQPPPLPPSLSSVDKVVVTVATTPIGPMVVPLPEVLPVPMPVPPIIVQPVEPPTRNSEEVIKEMEAKRKEKKRQEKEKRRTERHERRRSRLAQKLKEANKALAEVEFIKKKLPGIGADVDLEEMKLIQEAMFEVPGEEERLPRGSRARFVEPQHRPRYRERGPVEAVPLPPADKGILVSPGFRDKPLIAAFRGNVERKSVQFADGVRPGEGTSPSAGEDMPSPPPPPRKLPKEKRFTKTATSADPRSKKKIKQVKIVRQPTAPPQSLEEVEEDDKNVDDGTPPPPPPGSPPPYLKQYYQHFDAAAAAGYFFHQETGTYSALHPHETNPVEHSQPPLPAQPPLPFPPGPMYGQLQPPPPPYNTPPLHHHPPPPLPPSQHFSVPFPPIPQSTPPQFKPPPPLPSVPPTMMPTPPPPISTVSAILAAAAAVVAGNSSSTHPGTSPGPGMSKRILLPTPPPLPHTPPPPHAPSHTPPPPHIPMPTPPLPAAHLMPAHPQSLPPMHPDHLRAPMGQNKKKKKKK